MWALPTHDTQIPRPLSKWAAQVLTPPTIFMAQEKLIQLWAFSSMDLNLNYLIQTLTKKNEDVQHTTI